MEISNYKEFPPGGAILAQFSAVGQGVTYHRLKVMRSKKGHLFIAFPSYKESKDDPQAPWVPYVEMSRDRKEEFEKKCLLALEPYIKSNDRL